MTREEVKNEIKRQWRNIIPTMTSPAKQRVNSETSWICPLCGHGAHGDGLTFNRTSDSYGLKCFDCGFSGDIIDLYQQWKQVDYNTALKELAELLNIAIDPYSPEPAGQTPAEHPQESIPELEPEEKPAEPANYVGYYKTCKANLEQAKDYLEGRGISLETAARYAVGYDSRDRRIVIPVSESFFISRAAAGQEPRYRNPAGQQVEIFNLKALEGTDPVFVTEGAFDALSIIEVGSKAIALNSTSNVNRLVELLESKPTKATLVLALDNDEAGRKATDTLSAGLKRLNLSFLAADISGSYKDPNEALTCDREGFTRAIANAERKVSGKPDNTAAYIESLMQIEIDRFKSDRKTGFEELDKKTGGLYSGLYIVAAISSLGKTTFCGQLADQLAEQGSDVIYFSLEQSRLELVSKSLVRQIAKDNPFTEVNSLSIRKGYNREAAAEAAKKYAAAVGDRVSIVEGNFNCDISFIGGYIRQYIDRNKGIRPVVIIDYLQILQTVKDKRQGAKEAIDQTVTELKRLSRELDLTIIAVSSVNRGNYLSPISFESLKESGGIEFTADVIWGLQLQIMHDELFSKENRITDKREKITQAKAKNPRDVELVCLKNRYGISNYTVDFSYYPAIDTFTESSFDHSVFDIKEAAPFNSRHK